jgi:hypothetical protein
MAIDTLGYMKKMEAAGFQRQQAEALAEGLRELSPQFATKSDLDTAVDRLERRIETEIARIEQKFDAKFLLLQWMLGFNLVLTAGVLWRLIR